MSFVLRLPIPVSTNALFRNVGGRGRVKTGKYLGWIACADAFYLTQKRGIKAVKGPYRLDILVPDNTRIDIDNFAKPVSDYLVSRSLTPDDNAMRRLTIEKADLPGDCIEVTVTEQTAQ